MGWRTGAFCHKTERYGKISSRMKQLATDFEAIFKRDKSLVIWMIVNFGLSVWLFFEAIFHLNAGNAVVYSRYSDINNGYSMSGWWYFLSFAIIAIVMGAGHILIAARLHNRRGKDVARLFLGVSCALLVIALRVLMSIVGD